MPELLPIEASTATLDITSSETNSEIPLIVGFFTSYFFSLLIRIKDSRSTSKTSRIGNNQVKRGRKARTEGVKIPHTIKKV
jgi:hypothetical protein